VGRAARLAGAEQAVAVEVEEDDPVGEGGLAGVAGVVTVGVLERLPLNLRQNEQPEVEPTGVDAALNGDVAGARRRLDGTGLAGRADAVGARAEVRAPQPPVAVRA